MPIDKRQAPVAELFVGQSATTSLTSRPSSFLPSEPSVAPPKPPPAASKTSLSKSTIRTSKPTIPSKPSQLSNAAPALPLSASRPAGGSSSAGATHPLQGGYANTEDLSKLWDAEGAQHHTDVKALLAKGTKIKGLEVVDLMCLLHAFIADYPKIPSNHAGHGKDVEISRLWVAVTGKTLSTWPRWRDIHKAWLDEDIRDLPRFEKVLKGENVRNVKYRIDIDMSNPGAVLPPPKVHTLGDIWEWCRKLLAQSGEKVESMEIYTE